MTRRYLVFDLDGTLIDSHRDIGDAVNETLAALGRPPRTYDEVKRMIGEGVHQLLRNALETEDRAEVDAARALFLPRYEKRLVVHTRLYPGLDVVLPALVDRGERLAVATNKPAAFTEAILEKLGLRTLGIEAAASADEVPKRKPDPAVLALALARLGVTDVDPAEVAYAGDMALDVETARRFGCRSIAVRWGFNPESAAGAGPDQIMERPEDLLTA